MTAGLTRQTWQQYIVWGPENWRRISNPIGKLNVGMRFLLAAARQDERAFKVRRQLLRCQLTAQDHRDDFIAVWFQSIVARELSVQHAYTALVLNLAGETSLFADLPLVKDPDLRLYTLELADLEARRVPLLRGTS